MFPSIMHFNRWIRCILVVLVLLSHVSPGNSYRSSVNFENSRGCSFIKCKKNERCVQRKFLCERNPCPTMLYCAKTRIELLRGPASCDPVKCSKEHVCILKVRHCSWNAPCKDIVARCVTKQDYYNGPATCAGFTCALGQHCILRESLCLRPPCKLFKSCANTQDVHVWMNKCKSLGCVSEYECFLRKPRENCRPPHCKHTPDCLATSEKELLASEKCNGWICPKGQQCAYQVQSPCSSDNCRITRSCHGRPNPLNDSTVPTSHYRQMQKLRFFDPSSHPSTPPAPWIDNFRLKNNAQAIKYLIKEAKDEIPYNREEFRQWLNSVKDILGQQSYNLWLDEIRAITINNKHFHDWFQTLDSRNSTVKITQQEKPFWNILRRNNDHSEHEIISGEHFFNVKYENLSEYNFDNSRRHMGLNHLLIKLREGRHMYLNVINKTNELVSTVEQLLPSQPDRILEEVPKPPETRKSFNQSMITTVDVKNTTLNAPITRKMENYQISDYYSDDNDTDFVLVDYGEGEQIELNQTVPRVIIRVENNMHRPIKIDNIHLKYEDKEVNTENVTQSVYDQNDYDVDEFQYFRPPDPQNSTKTIKYA